MIFPRSALICYITVDIFVCCSWVDLIFPEPHLCLPARVYSSVWCCLKVPFTHQKCSRVVGEEGLVVVEGCCAVSRSVRTHPSLSLLCPCSPPPAPPPPFFLLHAVTQCSLSAPRAPNTTTTTTTVTTTSSSNTATSASSFIITSWIWKTRSSTVPGTQDKSTSLYPWSVLGFGFQLTDYIILRACTGFVGVVILQKGTCGGIQGCLSSGVSLLLHISFEKVTWQKLLWITRVCVSEK